MEFEIDVVQPQMHYKISLVNPPLREVIFYKIRNALIIAGYCLGFAVSLTLILWGFSGMLAIHMGG